MPQRIANWNTETTAPDRPSSYVLLDSLTSGTDKFRLDRMVGEMVVVVNSASDFPAPVSGVITLEANKAYIIGSTITLSDRIQYSQGSRIAGYGPGPSQIIYTGSGTLFTATNTFLYLEQLFVLFTGGGSIFDCDSSSLADQFAFISNIQAVGMTSIGTFTAIGPVIDNCFLSGFTSGFTFSGAVGSIDIESVITADASASAVHYDLGSSTMDGFSLSKVLPSGSGTAISGLVSSGNINSGGIATVTDSDFRSIGTPLNNVAKSDLRWRFTFNPGIADSFDAAEADMEVPETVTINTAGVYELVNGGNWAASVSERFSVNADGEITFLGENPEEFMILANSTVEKVGGGSDQICTRIAVDTGSGYVTESASTGCTQNTNPTQVTSKKLVELDTGDKVAVFVANEDSTSDVVVDLCNLTITRIP